MNSAIITDKSVPQITRKNLEHISPLHRFCAEELIKPADLFSSKVNQNKLRGKNNVKK